MTPHDEDSDSDPSEATVPGEVGGVQLRTIHSAKGLEFPIVVIPECTRGFNLHSSIRGAHFERLGDEPVVGMQPPSSDTGYGTTTTATYSAVREQYCRRDANP